MINWAKKIVIYVNYCFRIVFSIDNSGGRIIALHDIKDINLFENKIKFLIFNFKCVSIDELLSTKDLNGCVALTFDDGYLEWSNEVYDILNKHQVPALFFVNSGVLANNAVESEIFAQNNLKRSEKVDLLSEEGLKKISKNPLFMIGGHTTSHLNLGRVNNYHNIVREVINDKLILENVIGHKIKYFAYPFGREEDISKASHKVVKDALYIKSFTIIPGPVNKDKYLLTRSSLSIYDSNLFWKACLAGSYDFKSHHELLKIDQYV
jgi:peptidoglycan/xylan/chitin deacetylase (PgdA/CDA1 family)